MCVCVWACVCVCVSVCVCGCVLPSPFCEGALNPKPYTLNLTPYKPKALNRRVLVERDIESRVETSHHGTERCKQFRQRLVFRASKFRASRGLPIGSIVVPFLGELIFRIL